MKVMSNMINYEHEQVSYFYDKETGLKTIVAIHDTTLGPAIGGCRFYDYKDEDEALYDVLRLSRGMTYKNAAAGLHAGGAKAVIIGDPTKIKSTELLKAYGQIIDKLNGQYYTAEDMNITEADISIIKQETPFCVGHKDISGDPAPYTALGVYQGMKAALNEVYGTTDFKDKVIAISGVGAVGYLVAEMLYKDGAKLIVADVNEAATTKASKNLKAQVVSVDEIYYQECDILAPCAMGAVFNADNVDKLKCKIIAGCANNVLVDNATGDKINHVGIAYVPDYIINAGGVINCGYEIEPDGYSKEKIISKVNEIYDTVEMIFTLSKDKNIPTYQAADEYAMNIIKEAKNRLK